MKKILFLILAVSLFAGLVCAGCSPRDNTLSSESVPDASSAVQSSEPPSEAASESSSEPSALPQEPPKVEVPDGAIEANLVSEGTSIEIFLPDKWEADGAQILEDGRLVAELHAVSKTTDKQGLLEALDKDHSDAEVAEDFTAPGMEGRYYFFSTEVEKGGMTVKENELLYCVVIGDTVVDITFHPAFGIGIGTQREEFETFLSTIRI